MTKIVIIGAGSGFGGRLSMDILSRPALAESTLCLVDIHAGRLNDVYQYVKRTIEKYKLPTQLIASTNRLEVLPGADFVVTAISQGGGAYYGNPYNNEIRIPRKYGIDQAVADTTSVGSIFRFLRTGPVQQQILMDVERLAPNAFVLNHTNPMPMLMYLHSFLGVRSVGLCHGVQGTAAKLTKFLDLDPESVSYKAAGVNHLAWFLEFKQGKKDLYPVLKAALEQDDEKTKEFLKTESVRIELYRSFGAFPTESNKHDSEYLPYFRRTEELREHYQLETRELTESLSGEQVKRREWVEDGMEGAEGKAGEIKMSKEYTTGIMQAILTDVPYRFNGNLRNDGFITNLPYDCCVEVPCLVDANGIQPTVIGALPTQLAALNRTNINVHQLAVEAVLHKDRDAAYRACLLDPNVAATLSIPQARSLFEEMWAANAEHMVWFDKTHVGPVPETCAIN